MKYKNKINTLVTCLSMASVALLIPELALADDPDAFGVVYNKVNGWVGGGAGKLITFVSIIIAGVMGAFSFPIRYILGALGTGLLLSSASAIVEMIF